MQYHQHDSATSKVCKRFSCLFYFRRVDQIQQPKILTRIIRFDRLVDCLTFYGIPGLELFVSDDT